MELPTPTHIRQMAGAELAYWFGVAEGRQVRISGHVCQQQRGAHWVPFEPHIHYACLMVYVERWLNHHPDVKTLSIANQSPYGFMAQAVALNKHSITIHLMAFGHSINEALCRLRVLHWRCEQEQES